MLHVRACRHRSPLPLVHEGLWLCCDDVGHDVVHDDYHLHYHSFRSADGRVQLI
jgi:hypothetical protein